MPKYCIDSKPYTKLNDDIIYLVRSYGRCSLGEHGNNPINPKTGIIISHNQVKEYENDRRSRAVGKPTDFLFVAYCEDCGELVDTNEFNLLYMLDRFSDFNTRCLCCDAQVQRWCIVC